MYTNGPSNPYPVDWALRYHSERIAQQSNNWAGENITRYKNPEMDKIIEQLQTEMDEKKQTELFRQVNWISVTDVVEIPIVHRAGVGARANSLGGLNPSTWESDLYNVGEWKREG
uniref:Solute-binding protein family 5 domain-containing protein n=1 Tax=Thermorudis sp. TaxID=1969470 RepID=A0A7C2WHN5_9BACT